MKLRLLLQVFVQCLFVEGRIELQNFSQLSSDSTLSSSLKATFHLTISVRGQRATGKIQRDNYHHWSCGTSLTSKTSSVSLIFTQGTYRNVKNRSVKSSLNLFLQLIYARFYSRVFLLRWSWWW